MKENDTHTEWTDADFDARCKSLLENRSVVAPKPRADMFATDARKWSRWMAAALLLSAGVGITVTYNAGNRVDPQAIPQKAIEVSTDIPVENGISLPRENAASNVALPVEDQPVWAEPAAAAAQTEDVASPREMAESTVVQPGESGEAHSAVGREEPTEVAGEQVPPVDNHGLTEVETEEVTEPATEVVEEQSLPDTSLPTEVNSAESSEKEVKSESDADAPILKLPLTVKPGGGHR